MYSRRQSTPKEFHVPRVASRTLKFGFQATPMTDSQVTYAFIGALLAAVALFAGILLSRRTRVEFTELGAMSEQWLAEQRANDRPY